MEIAVIASSSIFIRAWIPVSENLPRIDPRINSSESDRDGRLTARIKFA